MIGSANSQYTILEKIGEVGVGVVSRAHDSRLDRTGAIKFLPRQISHSAGRRQRFTSEVRAAVSINHPAVATIHAVEEADDETFIVMEYAEGDELAQLLNTCGRSTTRSMSSSILNSTAQLRRKLHSPRCARCGVEWKGNSS